jgi:urease accessory protein
MKMHLQQQAFSPVSSASHAHSLPAKEQQGWRAELFLGFRKTSRKTILAERLREGPLAVQRALYPEGDLCHVYLLHPPGGVAGGDRLNISAQVAQGASALVTTPGATKFYRTASFTALQQQILKVDGGTLEWLPQENIFFPGAEVGLKTSVELTGNARFIGWEINCLGLPVIAERFTTGRAVFSFSLLRDGLPLLHERLVVDGAGDLSTSSGLRDKPVFGSLYATLDDSSLLEVMREAIPQTSDDVLALTLVDGLLIARYLGSSTERCKNCFIAIWRILRPAVLNRPPCPPRIWNT